MSAVATGLLLGLLTAEVLLRLYWKAPSSPVPINAIQSDPLVHMSWVPNYDGWHRFGPILMRFQTNSFGLRDDETTLEKPEGVYRILVVGDSFVQGHGVEAHEVFSHVLEETLQPPAGFDRVEVIQSGVSGWGPPEEMAWIEHRGLAFQPDMILLAFYTGNDFIDATLHNQHWIHRGMRLMEWDEARMSPLWEARIWMRKNVFLWSMTLDTLRSLGKKRKLDLSVDDERLVRTALGDEVDSWENHIKPFFDRLRELGETCTAETGVIILPTWIEADTAHQAYVLDLYGIRQSEVDLSIYAQVVQSAAEKAGISYHDATPPLRKMGGEGKTIILPTDAHYNAEAHHAVGEWLAKDLRHRSNTLTATQGDASPSNASTEHLLQAHDR